MKLQAIVVALGLVLPALAGADAPKTDTTKKEQPKKLAEDDIKVVAHLHHVNQMEVEMGKLAQRVGSQPVKRYGEMLVTDHTTADKQLVTFAKARGLAVIPAPKAETDAEKKEMKDKMDEMTALKKLKGADFDREYLRMMVNGHDQELAKTDGFISKSGDPDLDAMLEARRTSLQRHSDGAKELQKGNAQASK
jgi:putative membrane protein